MNIHAVAGVDVGSKILAAVPVVATGVPLAGGITERVVAELTGGTGTTMAVTAMAQGIITGAVEVAEPMGGVDHRLKRGIDCLLVYRFIRLSVNQIIHGIGIFRCLFCSNLAGVPINR